MFAFHDPRGRSAGATVARTRSVRRTCVTVDFDTLSDHAVTVRERDSMTQERIPLAEIESYLGEHLSGV
jgi:glycyl-tRNA synthetase (class II)